MILSVIIPAYNAEKYINRCVDSVERAIHNIDSEVIIIDDGSQDRTSEVCHELALKYTNIRTITMNDDGVSAARNRGMELACGKYISFVDADDIVSSDMFMRLISEAEENDADIVGCEFFQWTDENLDSVTQDIAKTTTELNTTGTANNTGTSDNCVTPTKSITYTPSQYITEEILKGNSRCWSKIYRIEMLKNADVKFLPGLTIGEDMLFVVQATKATAPNAKASDTETKASAKIIELKDYKGYGYYTNPKGAINRPFTPQYMDQIKCWELVEQELVEEEVSGELTSASASNDVACAASLSSLHTKTIMAIMLVASKIATTQGLKDSERNDYITICKTKLNEIINKDNAAYRSLDIGYKIKVTIFRLSPALYLKMYGAWKK